ncbi:MAG: helix-turn-helix transcriptional regulator [Deltaproteobacteria bacterium]|nr:helix-turn-helix transcriptional regulator [Deltaproteobacteria bacterium]
MPKKPVSAPIGEKIRSLRESQGITLEQLANDTGHSVDVLRAIESGETIPPVGTLLSVSRALGVESSVFLKKAPSTKASRARAYTDRTRNYAYTTLSPGARHKHLKAFKVAIEPRKEHEGVGYTHEGEEFVYVLSGEVQVTVGEQVNHLKRGDSLHFNSGLPHSLKNPGAKKTELLVVVYTP